MWRKRTPSRGRSSCTYLVMVKEQTNINGSKCNGIRVIGDKYEEVDRADIEDLVNYRKDSISNGKPLKNSKQGTVIYF